MEMAALLHVNQSPGKRTFLLARNAAGWRIAKGASAVSVTLTKDGLRPVVALAAVVAKPPKPLPRRPSAAEAALPWRKVKVADCAVTAVATGSDCLAAGAKDGRVAVPDRPGLGIELDRDRVEKFARNYEEVGQYYYEG